MTFVLELYAWYQKPYIFVHFHGQMHFITLTFIKKLETMIAKMNFFGKLENQDHVRRNMGLLLSAFHGIKDGEKLGHTLKLYFSFEFMRIE